MNVYVAINYDKFDIHSFDFVDCPKINFVIKSDEKVEVYIVGFEIRWKRRIILYWKGQ